jgi:hypothetical protein
MSLESKQTTGQTAEEAKQAKEDGSQIDTSSTATKETQKDLVYDLDSGEMITREEYIKR